MAEVGGDDPHAPDPDTLAPPDSLWERSSPTPILPMTVP